MTSVRYEFDDDNRLILHDPRDAVQPRRVVEGRLALERHNRLVYRVRQGRHGSSGAPLTDVSLDGRWTLTPDHRLGLLLHPLERGDRQTLFLRGIIDEVKGRALGISLWRRTRTGRRTIQRLSLSGRWQADARNRLHFLVSKADGSEDRLVFDGGWTVDRRHHVLYRYRQTTRRPRAAAEHLLRFSGVWDLRPGSRLAYRLDVSDRSTVVFRGALQSASLNAREGAIAYQIGIRLSGGRTVTPRVVLFGAWKLHRDLSVTFEMPYTEGRVRAMRFAVRTTVTKGSTISVALATTRGEALGLAVIFSRAFVDDAELFLRLQRHGQETQAVGGVTVRF